jgi:hypothetical protein|tara:strand:- start:10305 stop:10421 length:117 start_codon:yes stop_codon:yes gene_type:complete
MASGVMPLFRRNADHDNTPQSKRPHKKVASSIERLPCV